jgi:putative ABC transport system substrate-binding protein
MLFSKDDPSAQDSLATFKRRLQELGWKEGDNVGFDVRWGAGQVEHYPELAAELVALLPDVVLAHSSPVVAALQKTTRTIPIVFISVIDPVGAGLVDSLARPGGNTTGFVAFEYAIAAKWLELLQEIVPEIRRVAVLRDPTIAAGIGQFAAIQAMAPSGIELSALDAHAGDNIEKALEKFSHDANAGLVVTANPFSGNHPEMIAAIAARYKLPALYPFRYFVDAGGLASYGPNIPGQFAPAADYVARILKGENPSGLPVQAPTTYELVINRRAAKAIGLTLPSTIISRANDVIE